MVREIVRKTVGGGGGTNITFLMVTRSNYSEWALIMECKLQAASLWYPMEDDTVSGRRTGKWWRR